MWNKMPLEKEELEMEPEIKVRLPCSAAHQCLSSLLSPSLLYTHLHHNFFFDFINDAVRVSGGGGGGGGVLLLRFYGDDPSSAFKCILCLKAKTVIVDGISRVQGFVERLDPSLGLKILDDPSLIGPVLKKLMKEIGFGFGVEEDEEIISTEYVKLGGFKNVRRVYEWKGLKLEVDQTLFEFGTLYEVECESTQPHMAKQLIEDLLKQNGIPFSYSNMSKFAVFRAGQLPRDDEQLNTNGEQFNCASIDNLKNLDRPMHPAD